MSNISEKVVDPIRTAAIALSAAAFIQLSVLGDKPSLYLGASAYSAIAFLALGTTYALRRVETVAERRLLVARAAAPAADIIGFAAILVSLQSLTTPYGQTLSISFLIASILSIALVLLALHEAKSPTKKVGRKTRPT